MIALISGLTDTLAYVQPQPSQKKPRDGGFAQLLASAAQNLQPSAPATPVSAPRYVVQPGDSLSRIAKKLGYADPMVLARANGLKNPDRLPVGQVLSLPENAFGTEQMVVAMAATRPSPRARPTVALADSRVHPRRLVVASWYGSQHHGKAMANGQPFNMHADTVAHRQLPLGTRLTLTNPQNGSTAKVQVTDRGPFIPDRDLDLSFEVARKLGVVKTGVAKLWMEGG